MACIQWRPLAVVIFHSDRGSQTDTGLGQRRLRERFATFKNELIHARPWPTLAGLRTATFAFIEGWYNTRRLHSSRGYRSPAEYEQTIHQENAARAA